MAFYSGLLPAYHIRTGHWILPDIWRVPRSSNIVRCCHGWHLWKRCVHGPRGCRRRRKRLDEWPVSKRLSFWVYLSIRILQSFQESHQVCLENAVLVRCLSSCTSHHLPTSVARNKCVQVKRKSLQSTAEYERSRLGSGSSCERLLATPVISFLATNWICLLRLFASPNIVIAL